MLGNNGNEILHVRSDRRVDAEQRFLSIGDALEVHAQRTWTILWIFRT